jgi:hypothetical protein
MAELPATTSLSPSDIMGETAMGSEQAWTGTGGRRRKSRGKKSKRSGRKSRRTGKKVKKSGKSRKSRRR